MATLTREKLREHVLARTISPVYVLYGTETYLRDRAARAITGGTFGEGDLRDFNESEFSLNTDGNLQQAIAAANQLPMMAARRVVRVTDVRISATGFRDTITDEHEPILTQYLDNPSPSSVMIFVADELNGVRRMSKLLKKQADSVDFAPLDDVQFTLWARRLLKDSRADMDEATLRHLIALVGNDAARLENEIEKLATAALPETVVTTALIDSCVTNTRELSNFQLTDYLLGGKRRQSVAFLRKILADGAEPLMILGMISYGYRRLLAAKEMMANGVDRGEVARQVNLRYRDQESFLATARRADRRALAHAIKRLAETDVAIKTSLGTGGPAGARMQIEVLVAELASI